MEGMEVEFNDEEFDLGEVVDDFQMSDDELERELKQLEKEENPDTSKAKTITTNNNGTKNGHSERKRDQNKTENVRTKSKSARCEIYEEVESADYQRDRRRNEDYGHHRRRSHGPDQRVDLRILNKALHISSECDDLIVGREVAYRLQEEKKGLFGHVVRVLGRQTVSDIFAETKDVVNHGGIKTDLGDRKRTPGGTFLYLMKARGYATPEQIKEIFKEENAGKKKAKKRQRDANFAKFSESMVKKEQGQDDEQPSAKKKKEKSNAGRKVNNDEPSNDGNSQCSQETNNVEEGIPTSVVSSDHTGINNTVPKEEAVDERPSLDGVKEEPASLDEVKEEPAELEEGEID